MIPRLLIRHVKPSHLRAATNGYRLYRTDNRGPFHRRRALSRLAMLAVGLGASTSFLSLSSPVYAEADTHIVPPSKLDRLIELIRTYVVYTMCQSETLIDNSPSILALLLGIPGIKQVTEAIVRRTFFNQFVGGDTAAETIPLLHSLRSANIGALFAYSVEVDENEAIGATQKKDEEPTYKRSVDEMIRCIDVAAEFEDSVVGNASTGRRTWVALKITALLPDAQSLIHMSSAILSRRPKSSIAFPGCPTASDMDVIYGNKPSQDLTHDDITSLRELHTNLFRICRRAQERGVKIILDAEYSWYQPAIDAYQLALMREFNKPCLSVQPLVYGTFQAYLRRTPQMLAQSFKDAEHYGYTLGVKLVRGAYHTHEVAALHAKQAGKNSLSISPESVPPVWDTKAETDACYNACAQVLLGKIQQDVKRKRGMQQVGVLFGTHNWESCRLVLRGLVDLGLGKSVEGGATDGELVVQIGDEVTERLTMGQLFGMNNALTDYLVDHTRSNAPMVIKYVPYGALSEVMPYLGRRAIENKSVLGAGAAQEERKRAGAAIRKLLFG